MLTIVSIALWLTLTSAIPQDEVSNRIAEIPPLDGRIVGGLMTKIEAFPYQVSVSYSKAHTCGGSILKSRVVVTAAHCVWGKSNQLLGIRAGSNQHNNGGVVIPVKNVIIHNNFNTNTMDRDIALLELAKDLPFSSTIQRIEMATPADVLKTNTPLIVSGWGATSEGSRVSAFLRYVQVQLINQATCLKSYSSGGGVSSNMFCAGVPGGGRDSCQGDSGGPLIAYNGTTAKLHGIVSWGYGCARPRYPGVYTKIAKFNGWLKSKLLELGYP